jgi:hypothetical protein
LYLLLRFCECSVSIPTSSYQEARANLLIGDDFWPVVLTNVS